MKCIICLLDSGDKLICDDCREVLLYYKMAYKQMNLIAENKDPHEAIYDDFYKLLGIDDLIEEDMSGLLPSDEEELIADIKEGMLEGKDKISLSEDRFNELLYYIEKRARAKFNEEKSRLKP